ncbi:hypothetical protein [Streptomyces sp. URMC 129]|uniref:hypothetical protein n=1 Tax=Streptomyces sp. URMC 129 TaxID=3423407 RepID=UPI003F1C510F
MRVGSVLLVAGVVAVAGGGVASAGVVRDVERGYALACGGEAGGVSVVVDLYQNSAFGAHASVSVTTADGDEYGGGFGPEEYTLFDGGAVAAEVPVRGLEEDGEPAGAAVVSGSYATAGAAEPVREVIEDPAGTHVVTIGTTTPLTADVSVDVLGTTVPLACDTAFAFDLRVWRITTGNG